MKNGFISISIVYSFVVIFLLVILSIVAADLSKIRLANYVLDKAKQDVVEINGHKEEGESTTYHYTPDEIFDYSYVSPGGVQTFTALDNVIVKLEVWGAQGGTGGNNTLYGTEGGKGGYSVGYKILNVNDVLYIYVGGMGATAGAAGVNGAGGYNGGGLSIGVATATYRCGSGGGATDIRLTGGAWDNATSLNSRIIVAGGGGGGGCVSSTRPGGEGGGASGVTPTSGGAGGSQSGGGATGGTLGKGGDASANRYGGGGGGYYGGGTSSTVQRGGGGGSGYIGGVLEAETTVGNTSIPSPSGGTETGHTGSGYARITIILLN